MNSELPKQFMSVNGTEIIIRCIKRFLAFDPNIKIIIALHSNYMTLMNSLIEKNSLNGIVLCEGGLTRFHSVQNALSFIHDTDSIVGIHDAARPFVSLATIQNCYSSAAAHGSGIPIVPVNETLRRIQDDDSVTVDRSQFRVVQTPQCFQTALIKEAFAKTQHSNFTDDASVLEATGRKIVLVSGNPENIKITYPMDLFVAKSLCDAEQ